MSRAFASPALFRNFARLSRPRQSQKAALSDVCPLCRTGRQSSAVSRPVYNTGRLAARFSTSATATPQPSSAAENDPPKPSDNQDESSLVNLPPDISTHYTIFPQTIPNGPPPASPFDIPLPALRREFLNLQSRAHPDKYPPGVLKQRAEALSARVNEAYRTLADPLSRGQYLLAYQHGIDVTSEDGAKTHPLDSETLMQVMEVQEAVEEAEDETTIETLKGENEARIGQCVLALGDAIGRQDVGEATTECVRLRFWYSIREGLREWEPGHRTVRLVH